MTPQFAIEVQPLFIRNSFRHFLSAKAPHQGPVAPPRALPG
jgi:hypothetical protein